MKGTINGLVKHSLRRAEERRIKEDSTGHISMAVSRVGTNDEQGGSVGRRKVHKAETRKKTSHGPVHIRSECRKKKKSTQNLARKFQRLAVRWRRTASKGLSEASGERQCENQEDTVLECQEEFHKCGVQCQQF